MLVSVIVLNYNGREHLQPCFDSLKSLNFPKESLEVLLVDNASSDGSTDYVRSEYPDIRVIETGSNLGFAKGNNVGVDQARGEIIVLLNNDMRVHPQWMSELVCEFENSSDIAAVGGTILDWEGKAIDFGGGALDYYGHGHQLKHGQPISKVDTTVTDSLFGCGGSWALRRDIYLQSGGFDEDYFAYYEDVDLGWRLWLMGYRVRLTPHALTYHRGHGSFKRSHPNRITMLCQRNALFNVIKNYSQERYERIFPAAVLLTTRKALWSMGIDPGIYRQAMNAPANVPAAVDRMPALAPAYDLPYYWGRAIQTLHKLGARALSQLVYVEMRRRIRHLRRLPQPSAPDLSLNPSAYPAIPYLVGMDDVIQMCQTMFEKRTQIQRLRKRSDEEIIPLFHVDQIEPESHYQALEQALGIHELMSAPSSTSTRVSNNGAERC